MKKWLLIVGAGLLVVGATILLTPVGGAVAVATAGEWAVIGGGGAVMAGLVNDQRMSEDEIDEVFELAEPKEAPLERRFADPSEEPESLDPLLSAALTSNDLSVRKVGRATLVELAESDPKAALGAIEVGLTSPRNQVRTAAGEALILVTERLEDPSEVHSLVVRAIRSPHYRLRRQGGDALRVFARRTSEAKEQERRSGLVAQLPPALTSKPLTTRARRR